MMHEDRLARIRLVSARYRDLQGLRYVCVGMALALTFGGTLALPFVPPGPLWLTQAAMFLALVVPGHFWLDRYYAATFGRQVPARDHHGVRAGLLVFAAMFVIDAALRTGPLAASALIAGVYSLWIAVRDWPFRPHHVSAAVVAAVGVALHLSPFGAASPSQATAATMGLLGVTWILIGFLDHRLLVSLMQARQDEAEAIEPARE